MNNILTLIINNFNELYKKNDVNEFHFRGLWVRIDNRIMAGFKSL